MNYNIGDYITAMQYDIGEIRECEILFRYTEDEEYPSLDVILYRYRGQIRNEWFYRSHRLSEVIGQVRKAKEVNKK